MNDLVDQLTIIADAMNTITAVPDASVAYDAASDSLVWSDELPRPGRFKVRDLWCLRPVLRYRTSLILDAPESQFITAWDEALRLFPKWPGFASKRQALSLKTKFEQLSGKARSSLEKLFY